MGEKDEEFESYPWVVVGGAEVVGGGRSWALHGGRWPGVELGGGGATPARERWRGLAGEVQGGERNPFRGSIGAEEGRRVWFHGEPSLPAAMAWAAFLRASREGDGPFYRRAMEGRWVWASWKAVYWGRRGRGGRSQARRVARPWQHRGEQERNGGACRARGNDRRAGLGQT